MASRPGAKAPAKPLDRAATDATRKTVNSVAAEIGKCLEAHGVKPFSKSALKVDGELSKGRFKVVERGTLAVKDKDGNEKARDVVIMRYSREASDAQEISILAILAEQTASVNFVPELFGAMNDRANTVIVQERARWGTLKNVVGEADDERPIFTAAHKLKTCGLLARAMEFLGQVHLVHADFSCRNVVVFRIEESADRTVVKVTDFGLAIVLPEGVDSQVVKQPLPTRWAAPETAATSKYSCRSDVWSFGCGIWEMYASGEAPWVKREKRADVTARLKDLSQNDPLIEGGLDVSDDFPIQPDCSQETHNTLLSCFQVDEHVRPTFTNLAETFEDLYAKEFPPLRASLSRAALPLAEGGEPGERPFADIESFLWSPIALEFLGEETASAFKAEFTAMKAKETTLEKLLQDPDYGLTLLKGTESPNERSRPELSYGVGRTIESPYRRPSPSGSIFSTGATGSPMFGWRGHMYSKSSLPSWSVSSLSPSASGPALNEQKFANEVDAVKAYLGIPDGPCILRDPSGQQLMARAWVQEPPRLLSRTYSQTVY